MRIPGLDLLRGLAIILVLFRHSNLENNIIKDFGWLGVDLFFVLSGFLVSGLIFREYKRVGEVNLKRFLIRRGFKIYPPFYIFMVVGIFVHFFKTDSFPQLRHILSEAFYVQSYLPRIWNHTWSLAVEEHFYLGLALLVFIAIKSKVLTNRKLIISFLVVLLTSTFLMRLYVSYPHRHEESFSFVQTHLRSDGIIIGVLISYLYHFTGFYDSFLKWKKSLFAIAIILILPGFIFRGGGYFMNTIGLTTVNLGFGIFTLLSLKYTHASNYLVIKLPKQAVRLLCFIGVHSYSIYLWHLMAVDIAEKFELNPMQSSALSISLAIVIGVACSYIIERPFLKLRDSIVK
ncbi:MAG: acyltransferase [Bacteroidales bacterium]|nr:acyltransferase [Bacteroidales bacterium]MCF8454551.1 acyltransferase [Bacteroidales bacterium]